LEEKLVRYLLYNKLVTSYVCIVLSFISNLPECVVVVGMEVVTGIEVEGAAWP